MIPALLSLVAPEVNLMETYGAINYDKVVTLTALGFQCILPW